MKILGESPVMWAMFCFWLIRFHRINISSIFIYVVKGIDLSYNFGGESVLIACEMKKLQAIFQRVKIEQKKKLSCKVGHPKKITKKWKK